MSACKRSFDLAHPVRASQDVSLVYPETVVLPFLVRRREERLILPNEDLLRENLFLVTKLPLTRFTTNFRKHASWRDRYPTENAVAKKAKYPTYYARRFRERGITFQWKQLYWSGGRDCVADDLMRDELTHGSWGIWPGFLWLQ